MSSILKALKKLEHEKAVKKPGAFRIDADILRGGSPRRPFATSILFAAIAIFACGVGATYFFMKRDTRNAPAPSAQTSRNEAASVPSTGTATVQTVPAIPAEHTLRAAAKVLPKGAQSERPERSSEYQQSQQTKQRVKTADDPPHAASPEPRSTTPVAPAVAAAKAAVVLKVNGIAFQDGGADGVAVVNGVAVSKGSVIEGARVEEIQKDRVKFSRGGEKFEIILDKSN
jgi:general secretion pathway protein B